MALNRMPFMNTYVDNVTENRLSTILKCALKTGR